jgi:hypothetical protein
MGFGESRECVVLFHGVCGDFVELVVVRCECPCFLVGGCGGAMES